MIMGMVMRTDMSIIIIPMGVRQPRARRKIDSLGLG